MVAITLSEIAAATYGTVYWNSMPLGASLALALYCVVVNCLNYQCIAHSFIHLPFFARQPLNRVFSVVSSVALLAPQTLYREHHLEHHRYNNDRPDPETGKTGDGSSTYRYSQVPGREEHVLLYSLLGPFRVDYPHLIGRSQRHGNGPLTWIEFAALAVYVIAVGTLNGRGLLCFLAPVWFMGQAFALAHNYAEHHGAQPGNRLANSVSCYGRLYNLFWFNEGYHQEHHCRPQTHWTKLPTLRPLMLPENLRRVVPFTHWLNFGARATPTPAESSAEAASAEL
jgi:fatty acid desaturase